MNKKARLLTPKEINNVILSVYEGFDDAKGYIRARHNDYVEAGAKAQAVKTASIKDAEWEHHVDHIVENTKILERAKCQKRIEEIFEGIGKRFFTGYHLLVCTFDRDGKRHPDCPICFWQSLKEKYLKQGVSK